MPTVQDGANRPVITATSVSLAQELAPRGRVLRKPQHTFQVEHRPYEIQPFMIAPVFPGETMEQCLLQARAVTDPVKHPLIGWWLEHYIFYVKLTDLDDRSYMMSMLIDDSSTLTGAAALNATAVTEMYKQGISTYDYVSACLKRVTEEYFRDQDETLTYGSAVFSGSGTYGGLPLATAHVKESWMQSLMLDDVETTPEPMQGPNEPVFDDYLEKWQRMRQMRLTPLTYQEYLAEHGIKAKESEDLYRPELIRYSRDWTYPSNTVEPSTGVPSSACSWSIAERADKARLFKEPGFVFGVTVARPKVYFSKQKGYLAQHMVNAFQWLPQMMSENPETSLSKFLAAAGPLAGNTGALDYWVDMRDLALYGDQFLNFALTETDNGLVGLPGAALTKAAQRYPAIADIEALFMSSAGSGTKAGRTIRQDGVVALSIKGRQVDYT